MYHSQEFSWQVNLYSLKYKHNNGDSAVNTITVGKRFLPWGFGALFSCSELYMMPNTVCYQRNQYIKNNI